MIKLFYTLFSLCILATASYGSAYNVRNATEFMAAAAQVKPGDEIVIANGSYQGWAVALSASGTAKKPISIKAQTAGQVIFSGDVYETMFDITGSYVQFSGINFTNCNLIKANGKNGMLIQLSNTLYSRITNCKFDHNVAKAQFMALVIIGGKGEYNRLDHCVFDGNVDNQDMQVKITKNECPLNTLIDHNTFGHKAKVSWSNNNGGECVQVGQDPILLGNQVSKTLVRNNTFTECSAEPEVISNKSSGNSYVSNSFKDCDGELVMRGGHDCFIDSNTINGGKSGIRVNGTGHRITNNQITGVTTAIRLMYGMAKGKTETGFYIAAENCVIRNNTISNSATGILVGDAKNEDWTGKFDTKRYPSRVMQDVAPGNNHISNNTFNKVDKTIVYQ